jgi:hypothetical protein
MDNIPSHVKRQHLVRPIGVRTRIFGVIGMLWGGLMVFSSLLQGGRIGTAIIGVVFMVIAGYWVFARDKPSALGEAGARVPAAEDEQERSST